MEEMAQIRWRKDFPWMEPKFLKNRQVQRNPGKQSAKIPLRSWVRLNIASNGEELASRELRESTVGQLSQRVKGVLNDKSAAIEDSPLIKHFSSKRNSKGTQIGALFRLTS